jgi:hypothetical protein
MRLPAGGSTAALARAGAGQSATSDTSNHAATETVSVPVTSASSRSGIMPIVPWGPYQFVNRRMRTLRISPKAVNVAMSDEPP